MEGKNPPPMPWSKVVKSSLSTNINVKGFDLKDMFAEEKANEDNLLKQAQALKKAYSDGVAEGISNGMADGIEKGYQRGFEEGAKSATEVKESELAEYHKITKIIEQILAGLTNFSEKIVLSAEKDVLEISVAVASQIVRKEISENQDILMAYVTEGLKKLGPTETAYIKIHPSDFDLLSKKSQWLLEQVEGVQCLTFEHDLGLQSGDCIVESTERSIDGRPDSQLAIIKRRLLSNLSTGKNP